MAKVKNLFTKMLQRFGKNHKQILMMTNNCNDSLEEIQQNQANERMLQEAMAMEFELELDNHLLFCIETTAGSFYWQSL
ncbi:enhancer of split m6 protein [Drosophila tropicalis]|uniref:enhancer of split m6 protein n=1 Tax=Drosophila tropicalis TaxID=46794 RepID=UPI0035ABDE64